MKCTLIRSVPQNAAPEWQAGSLERLSPTLAITWPQIALGLFDSLAVAALVHGDVGLPVGTI
jgi:hypothetical protein